MAMINKVLCDRSQSFSDVEKAQGRANIGAMAASASSEFAPASAGFSGCSANAPITGDGTSGSPLGLSSRITLASAGAMNDMTPRYQQFTAGSLSSLHEAGYSDYEQDHYTSWIDPQKVVFKNDSGVQEQVDYSSIQRWNSYSAGMTVSANNGITGNGSTSSPIGLSSRIEFPSSNSAAAVGHRGMTVSTDNHTAWYYGAFASFEAATASANYRASEAEFSNASGTSVVNKSSIDRWNSYSAGTWNESGNSLSTGYGGYQVSAAWQYNETGNWAARTVGISGSPDQTMYGFQSKPNGTATYGVNAAGAFVRIPQQNYFTYLFHVTGAMSHQFDIEIFPTGLTADARFDFVNLCSAASANIKTDTFHGTTATINPGESATMWYIATADVWTDGTNLVPV